MDIITKSSVSIKLYGVSNSKADQEMGQVVQFDLVFQKRSFEEQERKEKMLQVFGQCCAGLRQLNNRITVATYRCTFFEPHLYFCFNQKINFNFLTKLQIKLDKAIIYQVSVKMVVY